MEHFDKNNLDVILDDLKEAISNVAKKHNLTYNDGLSCSYSDNELTISKFELKTKGGIESNLQKVVEYLQSNVIIKDRDVIKCILNQKPLIIAGDIYTVVDYSQSSRKYPIILKQKSGKLIKGAAGFLKDAIPFR